MTSSASFRDAMVPEESLEGLMAQLNLNISPDSEPANLLRRCNQLLAELEAFAVHLEQKKKLGRVDFGHFQKDVTKDINYIQKVCRRELNKPTNPERIEHALKSSNLPFMEAIWAVAKQSRDVVGLKRHGQLVDVVADGGATWIKVSTISESRLLFEMAKQGWEYDAVSENEDDEAWTPPEGEEPELPLIKTAHSLLEASKRIRHKYRLPAPHMLLKRIEEGKVKEIDKVISKIRSLGISVTCANHIQEDRPLDDTMLSQMVVGDFESFSPTINIDCTILLAAVSDISHQDVIEEGWFNGVIRRQIEVEAAERLMPSILWRAMGERKLVCTQAAAQRMLEIVNTIGTETEKARTRLLMGEEGGKQPELVDKFGKLSKHSVPKGWQIPVKVVDFDPRNAIGDEYSNMSPLPPSASAAAEELSEINQAVFLYGWATGMTTITSNRTVAKQIEGLIEANRTSDDEVGPDVWVCATSRSLVAKEKDRRDGIGL